MLKAIFVVSVLAVFIIIAAAGIVLNRKECCNTAPNQKQTGDFTKGYICIYSLCFC